MVKHNFEGGQAFYELDSGEHHDHLVCVETGKVTEFVSEEIERLQIENKKLLEENTALQEEIDRLQNDPAYLEEKARKEYGLLKENEVLYIFKKKEK